MLNISIWCYKFQTQKFDKLKQLEVKTDPLKTDGRKAAQTDTMY